MNIYVGNLSFDVNDEEMRQAFEQFGEVSSAKVITDRYTGKSRGFGFVEMPDDGQGQSAIDGMNGQELKGRAVNVTMARSKNS